MVNRKRWKNGDILAVPLEYFNNQYVYCKIIDIRSYPALMEVGHSMDIRLIVFNSFTDKIDTNVELKLDDLYCNYLRVFVQNGRTLPSGWLIVRNDPVSHIELIDMDYRSDGIDIVKGEKIGTFRSESRRIQVLRCTKLSNIIHLEVGNDWNLELITKRIYLEISKKNEIELPLEIKDPYVWKDLVKYFGDAPHFFDIPVEKRFRAVCDWTEYVP